MKNNKGIAVILMLAVMLILWGLGFAFVQFVQVRQKKLDILQGHWPLRLAAESALVRAVGVLKMGDTNSALPIKGVINDIPYEVTIEDEASKINMNPSYQLREAHDRVRDRLLQNLNIGELDSSAVNQYRFNHQWFNSIRELFFFLPGDEPQAVFPLINSLITTRSYDRNRLLNVWRLVQKFSEDTDSDVLITQIYEEEGVQVVQALLNLIDFMDDDVYPTVMELGSGDLLLGREPSPLITELRMKTSEIDPDTVVGEGYAFEYSYGGEFIELFNPYDISLNLDGYRLRWTSKQNGREEISLDGRVLAPGDFLIITDHTARLVNYHQGLLGNPNVVAYDRFEINEVDYEDVHLLLHDLVIDRMPSIPVSLDASIEKGDPRNGERSNLSEGGSPGARNREFIRHMATANEHEFLNSGTEGYDFREGLAQLALLYGDRGAWQPIALHSSDYHKGADEGAWPLLKSVYWLNEDDEIDYDDDLTTTSGRININTASALVLQALFDIPLSAAEHIERESFQYAFEVMAILKQHLSLEEAHETFWKAFPLLTVRGNVFLVKVNVEQGMSLALHAEIDKGAGPVPQIHWRRYIE